jgi:hypothetical protein
MAILIRYLPYHLDPLGLQTAQQTRSIQIAHSLSMVLVAVMGLTELLFLAIVLWNTL